MESKNCKECNKIKPVVDFYKKDKLGRLRSECKKCTMKKVKDYKNRNREKVNARSKARRLENYEEWRKKTNEYNRLRRLKKREQKETVPLASEEKFISAIQEFKINNNLTWREIAFRGGWSIDMLYNIRRGRVKDSLTLEEAENFVRRLYGLPAPMSKWQLEQEKKKLMFQLPDGTFYVRTGLSKVSIRGGQ